MKVKALKGFAGRLDGVSYTVSEGDIIDLPEGADWLRAGLVELFTDGPEAAAMAPAETATRRPRARKRTASKGPKKNGT